MGRVSKILVWVLQVLLGALFLMSAVPKLMSNPGAVQMFQDFGYPDNFYLLIGVIEVVGAILLLIPVLAAYGASVLAVIMIGASVTHLVNDEMSRVLFTLILCGLLVAVGYLRRPAFLRSGQAA